MPESTPKGKDGKVLARNADRVDNRSVQVKYYNALSPVRVYYPSRSETLLGSHGMRRYVAIAR